MIDATIWKGPSMSCNLLLFSNTGFSSTAEPASSLFYKAADFIAGCGGMAFSPYLHPLPWS